MSELFNKMMSKNDLNRDPIKLDPKRAELATALTKKMVNEALGRVQQAKQEHDAKAAAALNAALQGGKD